VAQQLGGLEIAARVAASVAADGWLPAQTRMSGAQRDE
jgi:hypothetical protein